MCKFMQMNINLLFLNLLLPLITASDLSPSSRLMSRSPVNKAIRMDANDDKKVIDYDLEMEADDHNIQTEKPPCELFPKRDYDYKEEDEGDEMEFDSDNDLEMSYDNNQAVMDTSLEMSNTAIYDPNTQAEIPLCELFGEQDYEDEDSENEFKDEYEDEEAYEKYRDSLWRVQW